MDIKTNSINNQTKNKLLVEWEKITGKKFAANYYKIKFNNEQLIALLYRHLEPALNATLHILKIKIDKTLIEKINKILDLQQKTNYQKKLIKSLVTQFKKFSLDDEFLPQNIQKLKRFNCAGSSLLLNHLLDKVGIKNYYGFAFRHVVNIAKLADGSLIYICTRANLKNTTDYQKGDGIKLKYNVIAISNKIMIDCETGIKYLLPNHKDIPYRLILVLPRKMSILSIIDNIETRFFLEIRDLLFPTVYGFQRKNKLWKNEEKYFNGPKIKKILKDKYVTMSY